MVFTSRLEITNDKVVSKTKTPKTKDRRPKTHSKNEDPLETADPRKRCPFAECTIKNEDGLVRTCHEWGLSRKQRPLRPKNFKAMTPQKLW